MNEYIIKYRFASLPENTWLKITIFADNQNDAVQALGLVAAYTEYSFI